MSAEFDAEVIASFGRHVEVRDAAGVVHAGRPAGRRLDIVCGDRVACGADARHGEVHVLRRLPRDTTLWRSDLRGRSEPVIANLTRLLVVLAPLPAPDPFLIDRYVAAAVSAQLSVVLIVNKQDLGIDADLARELAVWAGTGCDWVGCSARQEEAMEAVRLLCVGHTAALVGQSGVGKSSLVRRLVPESEPSVGELARTKEGRHTTTAARLYELPAGGRLIDSPGVRDFAPAVEHLDPRSLGFTEVEALQGSCRFADCRHDREPGCAVRAAVANGGLAARRYESFRRLQRLRAELQAARGPERRG